MNHILQGMGETRKHGCLDVGTDRYKLALFSPVVYGVYIYFSRGLRQ